MLDSSADVNVANGSGWTALHRAAASGQSELVTLLLEHGADISLTTRKGSTALHTAANYRGTVQTVTPLLDRGARRERLEQEGLDPASLGRRAMKTVNSLRSSSNAGADRIAEDKYGRTPLDVAEEEDADTIARLLRERADEQPR